MNICSFVITIVIVLFAILHFGKATQCYQCDSRTNDTCIKNPSVAANVTCKSGTNWCGKCNYGLNSTTFVIRDCGFANPSPVESGDCIMCKGDLCNNANMATISMTALGCFVSFWTIRSVLINSY
ncbi:uncharacterized protein [Polyergus mexicanus]|uniref:uncharacterized protein n=1 Tax=Polyergus mexicanus TaxID=615972 RepID=UPI0038B629B1